MPSIDLAPQGPEVKATPLAILLKIAYSSSHTSEQQIVGIPDWARSERYDIYGKVDPDRVASVKSLNQQRDADTIAKMLQQVFVERFGALVHEEEREAPVYILEATKKVKLVESRPGDQYLDGLKKLNETAIGQGSILQPGKYVGQGVSMEEFAKALSGTSTGRVVLDKTGLKGSFDFTLIWSPAATEVEDGTSIFAAMQQQLGLKLTTAKVPVKTVVIDHIDRPTPN